MSRDSSAVSPDQPTRPADAVTRRAALKRTAALLGLALSPRLLDGLVHAQAAGAAATPRHLSAAQFAIAGAIAERILPRTDTPGARDVGVPAYLDVIFGAYLTEAEKGVWRDGLADVEARARRTQRKGFAELAPEQQDQVLKAVAADSQAKEKTFFHQIRDVTLAGYFTSEEVGRNVTNFDPLPGRFDACIPVSEVGNKSWPR